MPCNAIATARARVDNETLAKLLNGEILETTLTAFLESIGAEVSLDNRGDNFVNLYVQYNGVYFAVNVTIRSSAVAVNVQPSTYSYDRMKENQQTAELLKDAIVEQIGIVGTALLSQQLTAMLKQGGAEINSQTTTPQGAQVVEFSL